MKTMRAAFASILSFAILVASPGLEGARLAAEVVRAQAPRGTAGFQAPGVAALGSVGANLLPSAALSPAGLDAAALSPALTVDGLAAPALSASEAVPAAQAQAAPVAPVSGFETSSSRAPAAPNARPTAGLPGVVAEPSLAHSAALAASEARTPAASPTAIGGLRAIGAKIARGVSEPALNAFFENGRALAAQESALVPAAGPRSLQVKESHADTLSNSGLQPAAAAPGAAAPVAAAPRAGAWGASLFAPLVASIPAISLFLAHPAASFAVGAAAGAASGFIARLRLAKPVKILALAAVGVAAAWFAPSWLVPAGIAAGFLGVRALMPARREKAAAPTLSAETQAANLAALKADIDARVAATPGPRAQAAKRERIAVVAAGRLPQGKFPSSMQRKESTKSLGAKLLAGLLASAGLAANQVEQLYRGGTPVKIFWGSVDSSESPNIAREIAVEAGLASIPGSGIAKNCGTSLEAVAMGLNALWAGEEEVVIAGGVEVMSRFPQFTKDPVLQQQVLTLMVLPSMIRKAPWWQKIIMRATQAWTWLSFKWRLSRLQHRFAISEGLTIDSVQMAQTAQTLADKYGFDRDAQDWFAWRSQTQAAAATARGDFDDEMVSYVDYKGKDIRHDQGIRFGKTSRSGFRKLEPVFGTREITAGNASQISDGASGVILMTESKARELGYVPMAYITAVSDTGVDPNQMGIGPAYSIPMALKKAGVELKDVQAIELNEAFAGQSGAVVKTLELGGLKSPAIVN
ncbi:MAG TPA: thiolase family protein, partial [Elusimicrobiota bacterium]|nr:thiolase family protein [Elusimicrobiota bacterium]